MNQAINKVHAHTTAAGRSECVAQSAPLDVGEDDADVDKDDDFVVVVVVASLLLLLLLL